MALEVNKLILSKLNAEQINKEKSLNGGHKKITHVLIYVEYGQKFGKEKQYLK